MKKIKYLALILIISFLQNGLKSQSNIRINTEYLKVDKRISEPVKNEIIESIRILIEKYIKTATFLNEKEDRISLKKMDEFERLFSSSALVFDDISQKKRNIPVARYTNMIYKNKNKNKKRGISFNVEGVYLDNISIDPSGNYIAKLGMDKIVYTILDKSGILRYNPKGNFFQLEFSIIIFESDHNHANILDIFGEGEKAKIKQGSFIKVGIKADYGILDSQPVDDSGSSFVNITPSAIDYGLNIKGFYGLNIDKTYLTYGISAALISIVTSLDNSLDINSNSFFKTIKVYSNGSKKTEKEIPSFIKIENAKGSENLKFGKLISGMVGITRKFKINYKIKFLLSAYISSSYIFGLKNGTRIIEYDGQNIPIDNSYFPNKEELENNNILHFYQISDKNEITNIEIKNNLSFGAILSPTILFEADKNWGYQLGFDAYWGISPLIASVPQESDIFYETETPHYSLLQNYFKNNRLKNISLEIGFYYILNKKNSIK